MFNNKKLLISLTIATMMSASNFAFMNKSFADELDNLFDENISSSPSPLSDEDDMDDFEDNDESWGDIDLGDTDNDTDTDDDLPTGDADNDLDNDDDFDNDVTLDNDTDNDKDGDTDDDNDSSGGIIDDNDADDDFDNDNDSDGDVTLDNDTDNDKDADTDSDDDSDSGIVDDDDDDDSLEGDTDDDEDMDTPDLGGDTDDDTDDDGDSFGDTDDDILDDDVPEAPSINSVSNGFNIVVDGEGEIDGMTVTMPESRTYDAKQDITIASGWTGNFTGQDLTVNGNGFTLYGEDNTGLKIEAGQTVTFKDTNISGFKTSQERQGAVTLIGGTLKVIANNHNVVMGNVRTSENSQNNVIYLDGTTSKVFMDTNNSKSITVNGAIRSSDNSNEIRLKGNGRITFNDIVDPVTITNENRSTIHNSYIDGVVYNLNTGKVRFEKDEYLNGQGNLNSFNFNGGTLDISNGAVGNINLESLNLNNNSNIMVDVDLANKSMDRITANNYNLGDNKLNVSSMNLLSDSNEDETRILFADENLRNNVTTTVKEVAYSPIYKYGVNYNSVDGNFTFVRGQGIDSYNPAITAAPVAAQLGGYTNMLETYTNAFNHLDSEMLKAQNIRFGENNANKYAMSEDYQPPYVSNTSNTNGVWVRPYFSYDNINLKNGPQVNGYSYGTFIGGDIVSKDLGNGLRGVFTPYISYQGSHQAYSSTTVNNNGGTLGFTGGLYKGKFFTGLTTGVGASGSNAHTMYGTDNFGMFNFGIAGRAGYNFEFNDGQFILQPSMMVSYTMIDTFNYTNSVGVSIHSTPLHALQLAPQAKFIMNTKNGVQPYLAVSMNWNLLDETKFSANEVSLPNMSVKPYVQYGIGVQKTVQDNYTAFLQVLVRNGGRTGVMANGGIKFLLGKDSKKL